MRLIDADKLKPDVKIFTSDYSEELMEFYSQESIDNAPTVDAEPVRHGEWVENRSPSGTPLCECSICKESAKSQDDAWGYPINYYKTDFCPNCGAKMDGDKISNEKS